MGTRQERLLGDVASRSGRDPTRADYRVQDLSPSEPMSAKRSKRARDALQAVDGLAKRVEENDQIATFDASISGRRRWCCRTRRGRPSPSRRRRAAPRPLGRNTFGQSALLARASSSRLRFVTVNYGGGTITPRSSTTSRRNCPSSIRLLGSRRDLHQRGLMRTRLLVCFGSSAVRPKMNKDNGRDHWGQAASLSSPVRREARAGHRRDDKQGAYRPDVGQSGRSRLHHLRGSGIDPRLVLTTPEWTPGRGSRPGRGRPRTVCMTRRCGEEDIHAEHRSTVRAFLRIGSLGLGGLSLANLLQAGEAKRVVKDKSSLPLPARRACADRDVSTPRCPLRKASAASRVSPDEDPRRHLRQHPSRSWPRWPTSCRSSVRSPRATPITTSSRSSDANSFGPTSVRSIRASPGQQSATGMPSCINLFPRRRPAREPLSRFGRFGDTGAFALPTRLSTRGRQRAAEGHETVSADGPPRRPSPHSVLVRPGEVAARRSARRRRHRRVRQQAFSTILGGVADAFDLSKEDARTVARYDTAPLVGRRTSTRVEQLQVLCRNSKTLANCSAGRRLCERVPASSRSPRISSGTCTPTSTTPGRRGHALAWGVPLDHAVVPHERDVEPRPCQDSSWSPRRPGVVDVGVHVPDEIRGDRDEAGPRSQRRRASRSSLPRVLELST